MTKDKDDEFSVEWSDEVKEAAAKDPKKAAYLREFGAIARQAMAGVQSGQYASFDDAIEALTGSRPQKLRNNEQIAELAEKFTHEADGYEFADVISATALMLTYAIGRGCAKEDRKNALDEVIAFIRAHLATFDEDAAAATAAAKLKQ